MEQTRSSFSKRLGSFFFSRHWLEVFLFGGIGFLLIGISIPSNGGNMKAAKRAGTENSMHQIQTAFMAYQAEYSTLPPARDPVGFIKNLLGDNPRGIAFLSLGAKDQDAEGRMLDKWGTPFAITVLDAQHLRIVSAGPDKKWQTADDLSLE